MKKEIHIFNKKIVPLKRNINGISDDMVNNRTPHLLGKGFVVTVVVIDKKIARQIDILRVSLVDIKKWYTQFTKVHRTEPGTNMTISIVLNTSGYTW